MKNANNNTTQHKIDDLESQLKHQKEIFDALFENLAKEVHFWKIITNNDGVIVNWKLLEINSSALQSWGKKKEEVIGKTADEIFGEKVIDQFKEIIQKIFDTNQTIQWTQFFEPTQQYLKMTSIPVGDFFISTGEDITNSIVEDTKLKKGANLLSAIFNNTYNFTSLLAVDGSVINTNKPALDFGGFHKEDILGKKFYEVPWWGYRKNTQLELKKDIEKCAKGEFIRYEIDIKSNNNQILTLDFSLKPVFNKKNDVIYIIQEGRDITEKEIIKNEIKKLNTQLEKKVKERTEELEKALETVAEYKIAAELSHVGIWRWDLVTDEQYWDQTVYNLYGLKKGAFKNVTEACFNGIHIEDRDRVKEEFREAITRKKGFDSIFRVVQQNSKNTIFVRAQGKVEVNEKGETVLIYGTKWDVTKEITISEERNQFAKELEQQYELISAASNILVVDTKGQIIEVNNSFCDTSGYPREELIHQNFEIVLHEDFAKDYITPLINQLKEGENWSGLLKSRKKDGGIYWLQTTISPFKNTEGEIEKFVSVGFDISEQKKLELRAKENQKQTMEKSRELMQLSKELSRQKYLMQTVFDNTDFMIFIKDRNGKFILVNKQLCKNLNLGKPEDVIGTSDFDYFDEEVAKAFQQKDKEIMEGDEVETFEEEIKLPVGKRTFLTSKFPLYDYSFKKMGICGISVDITDKKENEKKLKDAQAQLIQSEKLASLGLLTAGIAHEINNPLNYISGGYQAIQKHLDQNEDLDYTQIKQFLEWIKTGTERTTKIVRGLNDLSRDNIDFNENCDLKVIINDTLAVLGSKINGRIQLNKEFDVSPIIIKGNVGKLFQLFLNIFTNSIDALDAIENDGEISIKISQNRKNAYIVVKDNGTGIEDSKINKVFEPFYTTKSPGKGTGLGLFISNNIVKEHQGTLKINSIFGKGTKVEIRLSK